MNLMKDEENANKLLVNIKNLKNIRTRKDNTLSCKRCNATVGRDIGHKICYQLDRRNLVETIKCGNKTELNETFHTWDSDFDDDFDYSLLI